MEICNITVWWNIQPINSIPACIASTAARETNVSCSQKLFASYSPFDNINSLVNWHHNQHSLTNNCAFSWFVWHTHIWTLHTVQCIQIWQCIACCQILAKHHSCLNLIWSPHLQFIQPYEIQPLHVSLWRSQLTVTNMSWGDKCIVILTMKSVRHH